MIKTIEDEKYRTYNLIINRSYDKDEQETLLKVQVSQRLSRNQKIQDLVYKFVKELENETYGY